MKRKTKTKPVTAPGEGPLDRFLDAGKNSITEENNVEETAAGSEEGAVALSYSDVVKSPNKNSLGTTVRNVFATSASGSGVKRTRSAERLERRGLSLTPVVSTDGNSFRLSSDESPASKASKTGDDDVFLDQDNILRAKADLYKPDEDGDSPSWDPAGDIGPSYTGEVSPVVEVLPGIVPLAVPAGDSSNMEEGSDGVGDAVRLHIRTMVECEFDELRAEVKKANANAAAALAEIMKANQSLESGSLQTKVINMLEKFDKSHRENVHETVQLAVQKEREQTEQRLTQLDNFYQARFQTQDKIIREVEEFDRKFIGLEGKVDNIPDMIKGAAATEVKRSLNTDILAPIDDLGSKYSEMAKRLDRCEKSGDLQSSNQRLALAEAERKRRELEIQVKELQEKVDSLSLGGGPTAGAHSCNISSQDAETLMRSHNQTNDLYYCNSLSISGFNDIEGRGVYQRAKKILSLDNLTGIVNNVKEIKFIEAPDGKVSLRLTYYKHGGLLQALRAIGTRFRSHGSLRLKYVQLTPDRFTEARKKWNVIATMWKRSGQIRSFSYVVINDQLMIQASTPGNSDSLFKLPVSEVPMETESGCDVCICPLGQPKPDYEDYSDTYRLDCGHAFHRICLQTWLLAGATGLSCPRCREVPQRFSNLDISCSACADRLGDRTFEDVLSQLRISHCGHLHFDDCILRHLQRQEGVDLGEDGRTITQDTVKQLLGGNTPGCRLCANLQADEPPMPSQLIRSIIVDSEHPTVAFYPQPQAANNVYRAGQPLPEVIEIPAGDRSGQGQASPLTGGNAQRLGRRQDRDRRRPAPPPPPPASSSSSSSQRRNNNRTQMLQTGARPRSNTRRSRRPSPPSDRPRRSSPVRPRRPSPTSARTRPPNRNLPPRDDTLAQILALLQRQEGDRRPRRDSGFNSRGTSRPVSPRVHFDEDGNNLDQ